MTVPVGQRIATLGELLDFRARAGLGRFVHVDPRAGDRGWRELTSAELARRAAVARLDLHARYAEGHRDGPAVGHGPRPQVLLAVADPLSFIVGFFATLRAGLTPVPAPGNAAVHRGQLERLRTMSRLVQPLVILADADRVSQLAELLSDSCPVTSVDALGGPGAAPARLPAETEPPVAYVQYTSGSVSDPKPVALGHANVLCHLRQAAEAFEEHPGCVSVTWVPLHHDMGMITGVLRPLWSGYTSVLLNPLDFVGDPALWPLAMTEWRATHTSAPDFGYRLCARKVDRPGRFDLHRLRVARSAGEPVRAETLRAFADRFRPAGFQYRAFTPSYGLAEATLTVTTCPPRRPPRTLRLSAAALRQGRIQPTTVDSGSPRAGTPSETEIVSCGPPLPETEVEIIDPRTNAVLGERRVGEIWISGPQVVPTSPLRLGDRPGHRTGDLGFRHAGEVYLLGRGTERFQVAGENFYSGEIEALVSTAHDRLRPGRAAVFLARPWGAAEPAPVVLAECRHPAGTPGGDGGDGGDGYRSLAQTVVATVGRATGLAVRSVLLLPAGALPLTSSGKLQRERCRTAYERGAFEPLYQYEQRGR
jgi:acyl-CoA synthetase (AMP-forming)/AMP-acid ligase II